MGIAEDALLEEGEVLADLGFAVKSSASVIEVDLAGMIEAGVITAAQFIEMTGGGIVWKAIEKAGKARVSTHSLIMSEPCSDRLKVIEIIGAMWVFVLFLAAGILAGQRAPLFKDEILPVFEKNCVSCHNAGRKMGGLDLSSFAGLMAGGASGPVIAPGKGERSLLWMMIESGRMPLGGRMTGASKQLIRSYLEHGRFPQEELDQAEADRAARRITPEARQWWSFVKPRDFPAPAVSKSQLVRSKIDAFIEARLEARGWSMQGEADRVTLLRRASFALTGLAPTEAEARGFLADTSADAYEKLVDRLLESTHFGEHWARHWLDVAGYSDTRGDAGDGEREALWKYRDWVIRALNANKRIDRFLTEQFAGDQLINYKPGASPTPEEAEMLTATGYLRTIADITDNQTIYEVDKYFDALQKTVETSLGNVLGLTVGCVRCHDHKFDPLLQRDYFRLTAAFQATWDPENWLAANLGFGPWPSRMVLDMPKAAREAWIADVTSNDAKTIRRLEDLLEATYEGFRAELRRGRPLEPARRLEIRKLIEDDPDLEIDRSAPKDLMSDGEMEEKYPELKRWKEELIEKKASRRKKQSAIEPNFIEAAWDVSKTPSPTYILTRGNYLAPGAKVEPGIPLVLDNPEKPFRFPDPAAHREWHHTGRRLALAEWLVGADHPLTARVFVNRVWQFLFGEGIVRSVDDFGRQGEKPTHPELLDHLAVRFQQQGWNLKQLIREIVMSQVFRQGSAECAACLAADPGNHLLWRKGPLRLEAETIRDSMLRLSGLLDTRQFGKPEPLRRGPDGQWMEEEKKGNPNRRGIYLKQSRTRPVAFLHAFDAPSMTQDHETQRFRSSLPSQSLALLNSPFLERITKALGEQLLEQNSGHAEEAARRAFFLLYSREARPGEWRVAGNLLEGAEDPPSGLRLLLQALLAANDFLYSN